MKALVLSSALLLALAAVPVMAEGNSSDAASQKMKGPPNANGMTTDQNSTKMQSGRSDSDTNTTTPSGNATGTGKQ